MKFRRSRTLLETCRPSVALSELSTILKESCDAAGIRFHEGYWSESESSLDEVLDRHEMIGGRIFRLYGDRLQRTLHNDIRYYDTGCFVISRVHLLLDSEDWTSFLPLTGLFFHGLYLEECIVEVPTGGRDLIALSFAPNVVFRQTEFVNSFRNKDTPPDLPPAGWGPLCSTWIMNFRHHATVVFEGCRFGCDDVQISALYPPIEDEVEVVDPHNAKRQILRKSTPSDATPTETPSPSVSGLAYVLANASSDSVAKMGLAHLEFVACRGIRTLHLVSATRELILRGRNEIESILLPCDERFWTSLRMYMGLSEVIDAKFQDPARHRHLFLRLKSLASSTEDQSLLRASTAQIQRIEHFLIKEDTAAISGGVGLIVDHWQRRAVLAWGYWVSDFNRSWARCLFILLPFYGLTTLLACSLVYQDLKCADSVSIVFRPVHKIPFLSQAIQDNLKDTWDTVSTASKVGISVIGLFQSIVSGLLTFSLVRSLRR